MQLVRGSHMTHLETIMHWGGGGGGGGGGEHVMQCKSKNYFFLCGQCALVSRLQNMDSKTNQTDIDCT